MDTNFQFDSSVGRVFQIVVRVGGGAKTEILLGKGGYWEKGTRGVILMI